MGREREKAWREGWAWGFCNWTAYAVIEKKKKKNKKGDPLFGLSVKRNEQKNVTKKVGLTADSISSIPAEKITTEENHI